jgi:hypothetical protein
MIKAFCKLYSGIHCYLDFGAGSAQDSKISKEIYGETAEGEEEGLWLCNSFAVPGHIRERLLHKKTDQCNMGQKMLNYFSYERNAVLLSLI